MKTTSQTIHRSSGASRTEQALQNSTPNSALPDLQPPMLANGELGRIQELLFGKQLEAHNEQLIVLQQFVKRQLDSVRNENKQELAKLRDHFDALFRESINQHKQSEAAVFKQMSSEKELLQTSQSALANQVLQSENAISEVATQLNSKISTVEARLDRDINIAVEDIRKRLKDAMADSNEQKLDRGALATLLNEVASQLYKKPVGQATDKSEQTEPAQAIRAVALEES